MRDALALRSRPWFALVLACLAIFSLGLPDAARALDPVGSLTRAQGQVQSASGGAQHVLAAGDTVHLGDTLTTGPGARAELTMRDGSVITLSEQTQFIIARFDQAKNSARFELLRGAFRSVTGSIARTASLDFEVKTPLATIGIRGTDFWGGFFRSEELGVFMISGKGVYVKNRTGRQEITKPGQGITVRAPDAPPEAPVKWRQSKVDRAVKTVTFE